MIGALWWILRGKKFVNRYSTERCGLGIAGDEVDRPFEFYGCITFEVSGRGSDLVAEDGSGERPSQPGRKLPGPVKKDEQFSFAAPQLRLVFEKIPWREAIDIMLCDGLRKAIVEETVRHGAYVTAHCHPDEAVLRCARLGVECIEHGTLTSKSTAQELAKLGTFVVPTLSVMGAIMHDGREMGISQINLDKLNAIYGDAMSCLETMKEEGVNLAFGTDLLAEQHTRQGTEFTMRSEVFSPIEIMRQATSNSAELLRSKGELGCVAPGAYADLLLVNGDPTKDIDLLASNGQDLSVILRDGKFVKQEA